VPLIARYPQRIPKKIVVDPDKLVFTVADVCQLLGLSRSTVIRMFEDEPGVLIRLHPEKMHKRRRRMIRIPRNVYLRVRAKLAPA
jgi:AraC-like DNA-binding protein